MTMDLEFYDGMSGTHLGTMPSKDCALDCSVPGQDASEAVKYWLPQVTWIATDDQLRSHLQEYGAWDDLETASTELLRTRTLWLAAGDWREENNA